MLRALVLLTLLSTAPWCRFTVRDVAFVDLGDPGYRLYAFASPAESPDVHASLQRLATATFGETNVACTVLDPDSEVEHDGHRLLGELRIQRFPTAVLVHPDGGAIEIGFDGAFDDVGAGTLESVVHSPLRKAITTGVLQRYCVALLVEGTDAAANARAAAAVRGACAAIERVFDRMPKAVGDLPELLVLPAAQRASERVLLFGLGLAATPRPEPAVAVLFGRGRRCGPVLDGNGITAAAVLAILANAGQSCECELDRSWMQGPRIPLRWDADTRQQAVTLLGFDPANPLVKSEISGILARGPQERASAAPTLADLLTSYSEQPVQPPAAHSAPPTAGDPTGAAATDEPELGWRALLFTLGGLGGIGLLAAGVLLARTRRP